MLQRRNQKLNRKRENELNEIQQKLDDPNQFLQGQKQLDTFLSDKDNLNYLKADKKQLEQVRKMNTTVIARYADSITAEMMRAFEGFNFEPGQEAKVAAMSTSLSNYITQDILNRVKVNGESKRDPILDREKTNERSLVIERWISIATELHRQGNFFGAQAVYNAIVKNQVIGLYQERVPPDQYINNGLSQQASDLLTELNSFYDSGNKQTKQKLTTLTESTPHNKIGILTTLKGEIIHLNDNYKIEKKALTNYPLDSDEYKKAKKIADATGEKISNKTLEKKWLNTQLKLASRSASTHDYPFQLPKISDSFFSPNNKEDEDLWYKLRKECLASQNKQPIASDITKKFKTLSIASNEDLKAVRSQANQRISPISITRKIRPDITVSESDLETLERSDKSLDQRPHAIPIPTDLVTPSQAEPELVKPTEPSKKFKNLVEEFIKTEKTFRTNMQAFYYALNKNLDKIPPADKAKLQEFMKPYEELRANIFDGLKLNTVEDQTAALEKLFNENFTEQTDLFKTAIAQMVDFEILLDQIKVIGKDKDSDKDFYQNTLKDFNDFVTKNGEGASKQPDLNAITIMTNQRIMRYRLLLDAIQENATQEDKVKFTNLQTIAKQASKDIDKEMPKVMKEAVLQDTINRTLNDLVEIRENHESMHSHWIEKKINPAIARVREISYIMDDLSGPQSALFLMANPGDGKYKESEKDQLYLYRENGNTFYYTKGNEERQYLDIRPLQLLSDTEFNLSHDGLFIKYDNQEMTKRVFDILTNQEKLRRLHLLLDTLRPITDEVHNEIRIRKLSHALHKASRVDNEVIEIEKSIKASIALVEKNSEALQGMPKMPWKKPSLSQPTVPSASSTLSQGATHHEGSSLQHPIASHRLQTQQQIQHTVTVEKAVISAEARPEIKPAPPVVATEKPKELTPKELLQWQALIENVSETINDCRDYYSLKIKDLSPEQIAANRSTIRADHLVKECNELETKYLNEIKANPSLNDFKKMNLIIRSLLAERGVSGPLIQIFEDHFSTAVKRMYKDILNDSPGLIDKMELHTDLKKSIDELKKEVESTKEAREPLGVLPPLPSPPAHLDTEEGSDSEGESPHGPRRNT